MFTAITLHHPAPEHVEPLTQFMRDVIGALQGAPGLVDAHVARASDGSLLAGVTSWASAADFDRARPTIRAFAPQRDAAWTVEPDEAIRLEAL